MYFVSFICCLLLAGQKLICKTITRGNLPIRTPVGKPIPDVSCHNKLIMVEYFVTFLIIKCYYYYLVSLYKFNIYVMKFMSYTIMCRVEMYFTFIIIKSLSIYNSKLNTKYIKLYYVQWPMYDGP